jgi:hypothetical protein
MTNHVFTNFLTANGQEFACRSYHLKKLSRILLVGLIFLTACSTIRKSPAMTPTAPLFAPPTATATKVLPTPSSPNDSILWDDLRVTMDQPEITQEYLTDFGSTRSPSAETKFLWVLVRLKNTGQIEMDIPTFENFSVLYAATEIKPIYGHRMGYVDYTTLGAVIFPDQELDGWLRFDIPVAAELREMLFVFLPESAQVGTSFSSPYFPYSDDKPTYVWNCAP